MAADFVVYLAGACSLVVRAHPWAEHSNAVVKRNLRFGAEFVERPKWRLTPLSAPGVAIEVPVARMSGDGEHPGGPRL
jgi:hypothetical protein